MWNLYFAGDDHNSLSKYNFENITNKNITKLAQIYKLACIDNAFDDLYKRANKDTNKIKKVSQMLLKHDIEFWNGKRRLQDIGKK